jgi:hypothetical protein
MVMYAEILAIGPFRRDLIPHYEYPPDHYRTMSEGLPIVRTLFGVIEGTAAGTEFAKALGISDPFDFSQHKIGSASIDFEGLERSLASLSSWPEGDYAKDLAALRSFAAAGYDLYFLPNA